MCLHQLLTSHRNEQGESEKQRCKTGGRGKRQRKEQETKSLRERELFPFFGAGTAGSTVHFLSVGKEKVGGLLPSPLITLNDSNGPKTYL